MRRPSRRIRTRRFGHKARASSSSRLAKKLPALSGELVNAQAKSPSLFQAANLWQFGDWAALANLGAADGSRTHKAGKVALLSASANLQQGATERAAELLRHAQKSGCSKKEIASILVAGAHLNLGRASHLMGREGDRYANHFHQAAKAAFGPERTLSCERAIETEQLTQLGVHNFWRKPAASRNSLTNEVDRYSYESKVSEEILAIFDRSIITSAKTLLHVGSREGYLSLGFADIGLRVLAFESDSNLNNKAKLISGTSHSPVCFLQKSVFGNCRDIADHDVVVMGGDEYSALAKEKGFALADFELLTLLGKAKKQFFFMPYTDAASYGCELPFQQDNINSLVNHYSRLISVSSAKAWVCKLVGLVDGASSKGKKLIPVIVFEVDPHVSKARKGRTSNLLEAAGLKRNLRNRICFGRKAPVWSGRIWVDPVRIDNCIRPDSGLNRAHSGYVVDGVWSQSTVSLSSLVKYEACIDHWANGVSWESTGIIDYLLEKIQQFGVVDQCRNREELIARYAKLDEMFEIVRKMGRLKTADELTGFTLGERGGILVHIGESGELIFGGGGFHRLAMARALKLKVVPAQVGCVHPTGLDEYARLRTV